MDCTSSYMKTVQFNCSKTQNVLNQKLRDSQYTANVLNNWHIISYPKPPKLIQLKEAEAAYSLFHVLLQHAFSHSGDCVVPLVVFQTLYSQRLPDVATATLLPVRKEILSSKWQKSAGLKESITHTHTQQFKRTYGSFYRNWNTLVSGNFGGVYIQTVKDYLFIFVCENLSHRQLVEASALF